jgi:hypothetical protein
VIISIIPDSLDFPVPHKIPSNSPFSKGMIKAEGGEKFPLFKGGYRGIIWASFGGDRSPPI